MASLLGRSLHIIAICAVTVPIGTFADSGQTISARKVLGERLFLEDRFAHSVSIESKQVSEKSEVRGISCGSCHIALGRPTHHESSRAFTDFVSRSPIPPRDDGSSRTLRNTPTLIEIIPPKYAQNRFHFDGEFRNLIDLVRATLSGRTFGYKPDEKSLAIEHIASVIRNDDGTNDLALRFGGESYRTLFKRAFTDELSTTASTSAFEVENASDREILDKVSQTIRTYVRSLRFSRDEQGVMDGTPYDIFLRNNRLPTAPRDGESDKRYAVRLARLLQALPAPIFVEPADPSLNLHAQEFVFGPVELRGLRVFLKRSGDLSRNPIQLRRGGIGNCVTCHPPPRFTDFKFHNTGVTEEEYDAVHGSGTFEKIAIPNFRARRRDPGLFLPRSSQRPTASGMFAREPSPDLPGSTDLGLWNVVLNPNLPGSSMSNWLHLCADLHCNRSRLLRRAIARFKTPGLRNLGYSEPYLHNGSKQSLAEVILFYRGASERSRRAQVRNGAKELRGIALTDRDVLDLERFLQALNEDLSGS